MYDKKRASRSSKLNENVLRRGHACLSSSYSCSRRRWWWKHNKSSSNRICSALCIVFIFHHYLCALCSYVRILIVTLIIFSHSLFIIVIIVLVILVCRIICERICIRVTALYFFLFIEKSTSNKSIAERIKSIVGILCCCSMVKHNIISVLAYYIYVCTYKIFGFCRHSGNAFALTMCLYVCIFIFV